MRSAIDNRDGVDANILFRDVGTGDGGGDGDGEGSAGEEASSFVTEEGNECNGDDLERD